MSTTQAPQEQDKSGVTVRELLFSSMLCLFLLFLKPDFVCAQESRYQLRWSSIGQASTNTTTYFPQNANNAAIGQVHRTSAGTGPSRFVDDQFILLSAEILLSKTGRAFLPIY